MSGIDWKARLPLMLEDFVDRFVVEGANQEELFDAIVAEIDRLRTAHQQDPEPADDAPQEIEEPANDWPSAEKS